MDAMLTKVALLDYMVPIRTSIGMALAPLHGTDPIELSQSADLALYRSKQAGRHGITLAGEKEPGKALTLEDELQAAIDNNALTLHW